MACSARLYIARATNQSFVARVEVGETGSFYSWWNRPIYSWRNWPIYISSVYELQVGPSVDWIWTCVKTGVHYHLNTWHVSDSRRELIYLTFPGSSNRWAPTVAHASTKIYFVCYALRPLIIPDPMCHFIYFFVFIFLYNQSVRLKLLSIAFASFSFSIHFLRHLLFLSFISFLFHMYILSSACNSLLSQLVIYFIFNLFSFSFPIPFCIACYFLLFYFIFIFIFLFSCL